VFDLDAQNFQKASKPAPIAPEPAGNVDRLPSRARLQTIASILAMAALRRRARRTLGNSALTTAEQSLPDSGEGLDLSEEQSVHA
jgi:hypothetical protein